MDAEQTLERLPKAPGTTRWRPVVTGPIVAAGPEWGPVKDPPPLPEIQPVEAWLAVERFTDYYFRTVPWSGQTFVGVVPASAANIPGLYVQGNFVFPNLAVPRLLLPLFDFFDRIDSHTAKLAAVDTAIDVINYFPPTWMIGWFIGKQTESADVVIAEWKSWKARKASYREIVEHAEREHPWDPAGLSEPVLDPLFTGWYPPGSSLDKGVQSVPDLATPIILAHALGVSMQAMADALAELGRDLAERGGAAADVLGKLARALLWLTEHPAVLALAAAGVAGAVVAGPTIASTITARAVLGSQSKQDK